MNREVSQVLSDPSADPLEVAEAFKQVQLEQLIKPISKHRKGWSKKSKKPKNRTVYAKV